MRDRFNPQRRSFLRNASIATAAFAAFSESQFAFAQVRHHGPLAKDAVFLNSNENPLGPCEAARAAMAESIAQSGRYHDELAEELTNLFASQNGLKPEYVQPYAGSSQPLSYCVSAFCSRQNGLVIGDPGYEAATRTAKVIGAPVATVPLAKDGATPGLYYVASPNNPTGTITSRADIEYLLANKPQGSILVLDEAYIHFSDATPCLDLPAADKDIVVLRTFSKLYGMAGARLGLVIARPDLLHRISDQGGWTFCPVPATRAGIASLQDTQLVSKRKQINAAVLKETLDWLRGEGYSFTASQANHFMVDVKRPNKSVIDAMAAKNVLVGRPLPVWPTHVRITVGTHDEMARFRTAFDEVMKQPIAATARRPHSRTELFS